MLNCKENQDKASYIRATGLVFSKFTNTSQVVLRQDDCNEIEPLQTYEADLTPFWISIQSTSNSTSTRDIFLPLKTFKLISEQSGPHCLDHPENLLPLNKQNPQISSHTAGEKQPEECERPKEKRKERGESSRRDDERRRRRRRRRRNAVCRHE